MVWEQDFYILYDVIKCIRLYTYIFVIVVLSEIIVIIQGNRGPQIQLSHTAGSVHYYDN